jgi:DNA uptake protein ComE-like DNA-binding protein
MFRDALGRFTSIEQLRQVPLMNEDLFRKIAPYFLVD